MITERDIREKTFGKATFGGYDPAQVDEFLEQLSADTAAAQKEISTLRGKMRVLVEKIEEYRAGECTMQRTLLSAQVTADRLVEEAQAQADTILAEAQAQADAVLAEAQAQADAVLGDLVTRRENEEQRLADATAASADYIAKMLEATARQGELLTALAEVAGVELVSGDEEYAEEGEYAEEYADEYAEETVEYAEESLEDAVEFVEDAAEYLEDAGEETDEVDEPTRMFRF